MLKEKSKILLCFILSLTLFYGCLSKKSGPINNNQDKNFENYLMNASMIVSKMNQDEKVGEMIMPTYAFLSSSATLTVSQIITKNKLGGVLMAGNDSTAEMTSLSFKTMAGQFKNAYAGPKGTSILLGTDSVHGNQHAIDCVLFPQNIGLGATHDLSLAKQIGAWTAYQVRETGFNWGYAPTIAIAHNYRWGRTYESFSQDPSLVEQIAYNYILGMQQMGNDGKISGILATAKHFLGDGNTTSGMDEGNTIANSLDALWQTNGLGYNGSVDANVRTIMPSYNSINGSPCHFGGDFDILNKFRKNGIDGKQFKGIYISDDNAVSKAMCKYNSIHAKMISYNDAIAKAINAGLDIMMIDNYSSDGIFKTSIKNPKTSSTDLKNFLGKNTVANVTSGTAVFSSVGDVIKDIENDVSDGKIKQSRIDEAVTYIIAIKLELENSQNMSKPSTSSSDVALKAAEESLVLLKNGTESNKILPIKDDSNLKHVILLSSGYDYISKFNKKNNTCYAYDSLALQDGGWTLKWQGVLDDSFWVNSKGKTGFKTVKEGIEDIVDKSKVEVDAITDLKNFNTAKYSGANTIAIVVIAEPPYAEMQGDIGNHSPIRQTDAIMQSYTDNYRDQAAPNVKFSPLLAAAVQKLKEKGIKVITVLFSGRPVLINQAADSGGSLINSDAFIAAWLPGTNGGTAIANAIFGNYKFKSMSSQINSKTYYSNTLPFSWPKTQNGFDNLKDPLFDVGFGLSD